MKDATRNALSNHIGDASALVQEAQQALRSAVRLSRGWRRVTLQKIECDLDVVMGRLSGQLDELEPDGCPF